LSTISQIQDTCLRYSREAQRYLELGGEPDFRVIDTCAVNDLNCTLKSRMHSLREHFQSTSDAAVLLAAEYRKRQAKWLAISSQISACPLSRRTNSDYQSWLWQVKEGKINGAGEDNYSLDDESQSNVFNSIQELKYASDLFPSYYSSEDYSRYSCYVHSREDLKPTHATLSG